MPASSSTSMALSAKVTVQGQPVILNAGDINSLKQGIVFTLTQPTPLGSPQDFVDWINTTFSAGLPDLTKVAGGIPPPLDGAFKSFIAGQVVLDTLVINQPQSQYQLGVSYNLTGSGISLLAGLAFNGIGVLITHQVPSTKLAADIDEKATSTTITVTAGDGAQFTPPPTKTLNVRVENEIMTVTAVAGDTLTVQRAQGQTKAAAHKAGTALVLSS